MKHLHVLAAAGLVALAGCTDQAETPVASPPSIAAPSFSVNVTPVSSGITANDLAQALGGPGVTIQNATYVGSTLAAGTYANGESNVGFSGIVLATGRATDAAGPNNSSVTSSNLGTPGDADVSAALGSPTFDASVLSFEIVPTTDKVYFQYVFASDEYPESVNSGFADGFILKVNGQNCAVIGNPPVPITINTINSGTNSSFYRDNTAGSIDIQADGLTTVLTCEAPVNPGVPNTVKLAIADGVDAFYDSWVFIKAGSFSTTPPDDPSSNTAPVLAPIADQAVNEGSTAGFTASATDPDAGQTLTYSLIGAPAGASIHPATGVFSWTPTDDDPTGTPSDAYTFTVRVTDSGSPSGPPPTDFAAAAAIAAAAGAFDEQQVTITVSNVAPTVTAVTGPSGPIGLSGGGAVAHVSVSFTDPGSGDTHTTSIACGNSTGASAGGDCTYTAAGVYTVTATVTDDDGGSGSGTLQYVVVYDPGAGFVTGGGWITSPAGAYAANPALTGRANFGFNAKYAHGAQVPDGQTQFHFQAAGLNFHSTAYQWLVVAGARAQYKGTGTINGGGSYSFLLTVIDGQVNGGGGVDRFRLKIWNAGGVIYDNQMGGADDAPASMAIGGGSIVIHKN
jgi:hypothetical protein